MPAPSELARPKYFQRFQGSSPCILNQRPSNATGLPVSLCSPIFGKFLADVAGGVEVEDEDLEVVTTLAEDMCSLSFLDVVVVFCVIFPIMLVVRSTAIPTATGGQTMEVGCS